MPNAHSSESRGLYTYYVKKWGVTAAVSTVFFFASSVSSLALRQSAARSASQFVKPNVWLGDALVLVWSVALKKKTAVE